MREVFFKREQRIMCHESEKLAASASAFRLRISRFVLGGLLAVSPIGAGAGIPAQTAKKAPTGTFLLNSSFRTKDDADGRIEEERSGRSLFRSLSGNAGPGADRGYGKQPAQHKPRYAQAEGRGRSRELFRFVAHDSLLPA